ncbi:MAG TPA: TatD family hydrolase [Accumulibacter sp.]|nr:TatD family hydrolase [Accumulibacter sp.]
MLVDSHCHLAADEFQNDRDAVVAAARAAGVQQMIIPAIERANFAAVGACCLRYAGCFPAYGIHPLFVASAGPADLLALEDCLRSAEQTSCPVVAIGEIGLDLYRIADDFSRQEHFFVEQLKIARKFDLPVLLHSRRAVDAVLKHLRRHRVRGGIAHAFNGSAQQADEFIRLGFKLGFGGALTFAGSTRIRHLAATLPLEAIVLETDAPDMPPAWLNGGRNTPASLLRINSMLSELRGMHATETAKATTTNVAAVLPQLLSPG